MTWKCEYVHESPLKPAANEEEFKLHLAALEWTLEEPIIIENEKDIKSRPTWKDRVEPFAHQVQNLMTFCRRLPVTLLADEVGLGKTISAGLILSELMARKRVSRALVVCPKIIGEQWVEELDKKFGLVAKNVTGKELTIEVTRQSTSVIITTYQSVTMALGKIGRDAFDMLILDEAHKLRNLYAAKPPKMAVRIREALQNKLFKYVLMLTATPIQNSLLDMYALIDCLTAAKGHANPLGSAVAFRDKFLVKGNPKQLHPNGAAEFRDVLRQYIGRVRKQDTNLVFPLRRVEMRRVDATPVETACLSLVVSHLQGLNALQKSSLLQALFSSPQALAKQMENMADKESIPRPVAMEARRLADTGGSPAKLKGVLALLDELARQRPDDWRAVIFTRRNETQDVIGSALRERGISFGFIRGDMPDGNQKAMADFKAHPPRVRVLISTDAGAEGVNLQVCNVLVNFDLPWNPMIVEQRIGRVQRLSSNHASVVVWNLVVANSVEEHIVGRLMEKIQAISQALGDIESILEASDMDDDDEKSFENQILDMVLKSLMGQDVRLKQKQIERSIEAAKRSMAEQRQEIDKTLGRLDDVHRDGPRMERIGRRPPAISSVDFVKRAYQADGAVLEALSQFVYAAKMPRGDKETIAFNEDEIGPGGVFGGGKAKLFLPGKPAFERLAQTWIEKAGHFLRDMRAGEQTNAEKLARQWCAAQPALVFDGWEYTPEGQPVFHGSIVVRAKASNGVDGIEKLITGGAKAPKGHEDVVHTDNGVSKPEPIRPSDVLSTLQQAIAGAVENDTDLQKFRTFYEGRLSEELGKTGLDPRRRKQLEEDLNPTVFADIVAMKGVRYTSGQLIVRFTVDGYKYLVHLTIVPGSGQILKEPIRKTCAASNRLVPEICLLRCEMSNTEVLKHLLQKSETSGRIGLKKYVVTCPRSGKKILQDELMKTNSGEMVGMHCFRRSDISLRVGLPEQFVRCEFTKVLILSDEATRSQVSGKLARKDELLESSVSGTVGHQSEFVTCEATWKPVLRHEAAKSDFSGRLVRKDLLRASEKPPHRRGLPDECVVCAVTKRALLQDEAGKSVVSGKWAEKNLMVASSCSGAMALESELIRCEKTGQFLLPNEVARCAVTKKVVDSRLLVKSAISDRMVLRERSVVSLVSQRIGTHQEAVYCYWLGGPVLTDEVGTCKLTGLAFARQFLNKKSEFVILRNLLDGRTQPGQENPEMVKWLLRQDAETFGNITRAWVVERPSGGVQIVCVETQRWLGLVVRYFGIVLKKSGRYEPLCPVLVGWRGARGWESYDG